MSDEIPQEYTANYEQFRDILSSYLIERIALPQAKPTAKSRRRSKKPTPSVATPEPASPESALEPTSSSDAEDLADFTTYIATAIFLTLPSALQSLDHYTYADSQALQNAYPIPLTRAHTTTLLQTLDPSISDSLTAYGITSAPETPSNLPTPVEFLTPVLTDYLTTITNPPPPPSSTRGQITACELCARDWINLSYHHLIPRFVHDKAVKRGWHRKEDLQNVAWLCGACHRFVHSFAKHEVLAREYYTVELLMGAEEVRRFAGWVGGVRWKKR